MPELNDFCLPENVLPFGCALNEACKKRNLPLPYPELEISQNVLTNNSTKLMWDELIPFGEQFQKITSSPTIKKRLPERLSGLLRDYTDRLSKKFNEGMNFARQAWCMAGLPLTAIDVPYSVGIKGLPPDSSSTNRAYAFSEAGNILSTEYGDDGSERGAFRHILWQSDITSRYDENVAEIIGDCHEFGKNFDPNQKAFDSLIDADSAIDRLNNIIGRKVGAKYSHLTTRLRALKVLEQMHQDGYYKAIRRKNGYIVEKVKMSDDSYNKMYDEILNRRDENGKQIK